MAACFVAAVMASPIAPASAGGGTPSPATVAPIPLGLAHRFIHWDEVSPLAPAYVRVNLHWGYWQPGPEPDTARWAWVNDESIQLDDLTRRGYVALAVIRTGTVWANRGTGDLPYHGPSYPPSDLSDTWDPETGYSASYHRFIEALIRHYNGDGVRRISILAIENEASSGDWWRGLDDSDTDVEIADQYVRLIDTAYDAAKRADPGILVADSGIPSLSLGAVAVRDLMNAGAEPDSILRFANRMNARCFNVNWGWPYHWPTYDSLAADFNGRYRDIVDQAETRTDGILSGLRPSDRYGPGVANVDRLNFHFYEGHWMLGPVLDVFRGRFGGRLPPLLTTEMGMRSGEDAPPDRRPNFAAWGGAFFDDSNGPAAELIQKIVVTLAAGVAPVTWFIMDGDGLGTDGEGDKLELAVFSLDSTAAYPITRHRAAYDAYAFLARQLRDGGGHRSPVRDSCLAPHVWRYMFRNDLNGTPDLEVAWWDDGGWNDFGVATRGFARIRIPAPDGATAVRVYSDYQRPDRSARLVPAGDGRIELRITNDPVILRWEGVLAPVDSLGPPTCGVTTEEGSVTAAEPFPDYGLVDLSVAPNPARGEVLVRFTTESRFNLAGGVYDTSGRRRRHIGGDAGPGTRVLRWDGRDDDGETLPPGVYFLHLRFSPAEGVGAGAGAPVEVTRKVLLVP